MKSDSETASPAGIATPGLAAPVSIVIPAHDEARVIRRCLESILDGAEPGEVDIVIACNGCTDSTAAIAREFGDPVRVVETDTASKTEALNLGDRSARWFPRFYVDADVVLTIDGIRKVGDLLRSGRALAAAPRMRMDLRDRNWWVRAYYRTWTSLPYFDHGMIGTGVYALSAEGRRRFGSFPRIIADDGFVALHFGPHERATEESCFFTVRPPATVGGIVRIFTRVRAGTVEIHRKFPDLAGAGGRPAYGGSLLRILRTPALWLAAPVYVAIVLLTKWWGRRRVDRDDPPSWRPEETSRDDAGLRSPKGAGP